MTGDVTGEVLRGLREAAELRQGRVAAALGVSQSELCLLEKGLRRMRPEVARLYAQTVLELLSDNAAAALEYVREHELQ